MKIDTEMKYENPKQGITVTVPKGLSCKDVAEDLRRMVDMYDARSKEETGQ